MRGRKCWDRVEEVVLLEVFRKLLRLHLGQIQATEKIKGKHNISCSFNQNQINLDEIRIRFIQIDQILTIYMFHFTLVSYQ